MTKKTLTEQEANSVLAAHVKAAYKALQAAESIAEQYGLSFSFSPAYGMGGHYEANPEELEDIGEDQDSGESGPRWFPSSQSC